MPHEHASNTRQNLEKKKRKKKKEKKREGSEGHRKNV
jgi:ribosome assembly protein YihI (activator of Der GTPase)